MADSIGRMGMIGPGGGDINTMLVIMMRANQGQMAMPAQNFYSNDRAMFSDGVYERGGGRMPNFGGQQGIGSNNGFGSVPGFGGFTPAMMGGGQQQQMQQMMQTMMMMMMIMMQMMQQQGMGQQQQIPGRNPNQQQQNGQGTIELQKGQSFTTPGGCEVSWKENTVKIHEPGGGGKDLSDGFAMASAGSDGVSSWAKAAAWGNSSAAASAAAGGGAAASASAVSGVAKQAASPRDWKVWGDPHIQNPDGSKQDFKTKNAVFTLQDGSKVMMCADKPDGNVNKVRITLPGGEMNLQGVDQKQTTVYGNDGDKLVNRGTLDTYMQAFQNAQLNVSPMGNQLFPMQQAA